MYVTTCMFNVWHFSFHSHVWLFSFHAHAFHMWGIIRLIYIRDIFASVLTLSKISESKCPYGTAFLREFITQCLFRSSVLYLLIVFTSCSVCDVGIPFSPGVYLKLSLIQQFWNTALLSQKMFMVRYGMVHY